MRNLGLLFSILCLVLPAYAGFSGTLDIVSPRDDQRYLDSEAVLFQASVRGDANATITWRVTHRFNLQEQTLQGSEFKLELEAGIYDIEAQLVGTDGQILDRAEVPFSIFHQPDIVMTLTKKKISGQWFWTRYETQVKWAGAQGSVDVFHQKACAGGFTGTQPCQGFLIVASGASEGTLRVPYQKDDAFQVCESGSHPLDEDAAWKCSFAATIE